MAPRSAYRPFAVTLARRQSLSEHFVRLTFAGPDLGDFGDVCLDQRIKLVLGSDAQLDAAVAAESWMDWWRDQPNEARPAMRTYTARFVRRETAEVDVDVVTHGTDGPAGRFALEAPLDARAILIGADADHPEADSQGLAWRRAGADTVLLVGDETAQPAIANILRSLPAHVTGTALVEVPTADDALEMDTAAEVAVTYLPRSAGAGAEEAEAEHPRGALLTDAVREWAAARTAEADSAEEPEAGRAAGAGGQRAATGASGAVSAGTEPGAAETDEAVTTTETGILWEEGAAAGGLRVWVAADAFTVRGLRQVLLKEHGLERKACSFMGYWRPGSREGE